jgi:hypothetical protein
LNYEVSSIFLLKIIWHKNIYGLFQNIELFDWFFKTGGSGGGAGVGEGAGAGVLDGAGAGVLDGAGAGVFEGVGAGVPVGVTDGVGVLVGVWV